MTFTFIITNTDSIYLVTDSAHLADNICLTVLL